MSIKSLRLPLNDVRKDCINDPKSHGSWREQVAECVPHNCLLNPIRPMPISAQRRFKVRKLEIDPKFGLKQANASNIVQL